MLGHSLSEPQIAQDSRCANWLQGSWQEQDLGSTHLSGQQQTLGFCQPEETFWYSRHDKADHCGINFLQQFRRFLELNKRQRDDADADAKDATAYTDDARTPTSTITTAL